MIKEYYTKNRLKNYIEKTSKKFSKLFFERLIFIEIVFEIRENLTTYFEKKNKFNMKFERIECFLSNSRFKTYIGKIAPVRTVYWIAFLASCWSAEPRNTELWQKKCIRYRGTQRTVEIKTGNPYCSALKHINDWN